MCVARTGGGGKRVGGLSKSESEMNFLYGQHSLVQNSLDSGTCNFVPTRKTGHIPTGWMVQGTYMSDLCSSNSPPDRVTNVSRAIVSCERPSDVCVYRVHGKCEILSLLVGRKEKLRRRPRNHRRQ